MLSREGWTSTPAHLLHLRLIRPHQPLRHLPHIPIGLRSNLGGYYTRENYSDYLQDRQLGLFPTFLPRDHFCPRTASHFGGFFRIGKQLQDRSRKRLRLIGQRAGSRRPYRRHEAKLRFQRSSPIRGSTPQLADDDFRNPPAFYLSRTKSRWTHSGSVSARQMTRPPLRRSMRTGWRPELSSTTASSARLSAPGACIRLRQYRRRTSASGISWPP
jgi:hypothetical protein